MNLYGTIASLYPSEPSNFALVALFRSGELHRLTENFDSDPDGTARELLTVLAQFFGTLYRRKVNPDTLQAAARNSTSLMVLPPLPPRIADALEKHQQSIVSIFSAYAQEYSEQHTKTLGVDASLPISGRQASTATESDALFAANLRQSQIAVESRSPFVASSGHSDVYRTVDELARTTRAGVALQQHAVPALSAHAVDSKEHQLDAYVVDFYRHGSLEVLIRDNGIDVSSD